MRLAWTPPNLSPFQAPSEARRIYVGFSTLISAGTFSLAVYLPSRLQGRRLYPHRRRSAPISQAFSTLDSLPRRCLHYALAAHTATSRTGRIGRSPAHCTCIATTPAVYRAGWTARADVLRCPRVVLPLLFPTYVSAMLAGARACIASAAHTDMDPHLSSHAYVRSHCQSPSPTHS